MDVREQLQDQVSDLKQRAEAKITQAQEKLEDLQDQVSESAAEGQALASEAQEHMGATVKDITGTVQEFVGQVTNNPALETEGMARQVEAELERKQAGQ